MIISIEREQATPTPGKSPRCRARVRATKDGYALLVSGRNCGSVSIAKREVENLFGALAWIDITTQSFPDWIAGLRAEATYDVQER